MVNVEYESGKDSIIIQNVYLQFEGQVILDDSAPKINLFYCFVGNQKRVKITGQVLDSYKIKHKRTTEKCLFTFYSYRTFQKRFYWRKVKILFTTIKYVAATLNVKEIRMDFGGETCVKVEKP